uniref:Retrovirus-related Pol polyprotein from transposon TNT 1-94 n=1 Tax=Tanacetum cinerariifolium TaxID=118510 RepID=A0A699H0S2_TANCI|nr:retrovirus-related Pol polyprotein from transposon TNT 1-94 [Tanacetum cinerariifolium]
MKGILRQFSVARTPQQNRVDERRNMTLIEAAWTMLADSKLPTTFCAEAVNTACCVQNIVLVVKPHNKTPYKLFHGRIPTLSFMRPFGCPVTIINTIDHLGKFDGKDDEGFFVGYSLNSKSFRVFNSRTRIVEENLNIRFSESTPIVVGSGPDWLFDIDALTRKIKYEPIVAGTQSNGFADPKSSNDDGSKPSSDDKKNIDEDPRKGNEYVITFEFSRDDEDDSAVADMNNLDTTIQVSPILTTRIHKDHTLYQVIRDLQSATQTRKMSKNLEEHRTQKGNSCIERFKLDRGYVGRASTIQVIRRYTQEEEIGYDEVFAPVTRIEAIRLFLAYASFKDFVVYQMDVKSTFLYGKIEKEVYVCQPPGFKDPNFPDRVYKVEKALYGLHQAPRDWYETLSTYLLDNGFQKGKIDKTLFIKRHKGLQVKQKKDGTFISQDKYVAKILNKFRFTEVKNASTPMKTQKPLLKDEDGEEVDVHMYRSMIGSLMYLTSSRPDIMFAVCACARYQVNSKSDGFTQIVDFLNAHPIRYALSVNPTIYISCIEQFWSTVMAKTINGEAHLHPKVDGKKIIITESSVRRDLRLTYEEDEAVHKELGDRLVRATTTASSLEAKQDNGGSPRRQETMKDTISQTRFVRISKQSNDSLLARGNTLQSDEDRMKLDELMALCTNLQNKVLDLEQTKTTQKKEIASQHDEIASLKMRVKKLEKRNRSRTHELKRLYKVGLSTRVESSGDEESLDEVFNNDVDKEMFDVDVLDNEEVFVAEHEVAAKRVNNEVNVVEEVVKVIKTAKLIIDAAQDSVAGDIVSTVSVAITDKGKGITIEEPVKPKKKDQIRLDEEAALKLQAAFNEEERLAREKAKKVKEANIALIEEYDDIQAKIDVDHQLAERLQAQEQEELSDAENATLFQQLLEKRRKHFSANRVEEKRNKPPTQAQQRKITCTYLKNIEGSRSDPTLLNNFEMDTEGPSDLPVPDLRTMEELCQPSLNGQGGPIAPIAIQATNFGLKNDMIQQLLQTVKLVVVLVPSPIVQPPLARLKTFILQEPAKGANQGQNQPQAYQAPAYQALVYQAPVHPPQIPQPQVVTTNEFTNFMKENDVILKNMQTNMTSLTNSNLELKNMFVERETEVTKDTVHPTNNGSTEDVQHPVFPTESLILNSEPVASPVSAPRPNQRPSIPYPSRLQDQKLRDKANDQLEKFFQIFKDLNFNISFVDALILMPNFGPSIKSLLTNKDKLCELAKTSLNKHCSVVLLKKLPEKLGDPSKFLIPCDFPGLAECLAFADLGASINLMPLSVWNKLPLPDLSLTCMTLELADHFDADPRVPLILGRSFLKIERDLIDVFEGELTLHVGKEAITFNLDQTSRYSANYNDMTSKRIDVIDMACEEYSQEVLGFFDVIASGNPTP